MSTPVRELTRLRVQAGLTENRLAAQVGVQPKTIRLWEQGKAWPQSKNITRLAAALGCSVARVQAALDQ